MTPGSTSRCCQCTFGSNTASQTPKPPAAPSSSAPHNPPKEDRHLRPKVTGMFSASVRSPRRSYLETVPLETAVRVSICLPPALLFAHVFDERVRVWVGPAAAARGRRRPGASDRGRAADQHAAGRQLLGKAVPFRCRRRRVCGRVDPPREPDRHLQQGLRMVGRGAATTAEQDGTLPLGGNEPIRSR